MQILGYELVNEEKVERAKHGTLARLGQLVGGVGDDATPEALLAEYDRLGGLVLKKGLKVKTGSFYDFKKKTPRTEHNVSFEMNLDGDLVDVTELEAEGIKSAREKKNQLKAKKLEERGMEEPKKKKYKVKDPRDDE